MMANESQDIKQQIKQREYNMKKASIYKIVVFMVALFIGAVVSMIIPLRQTYSDKEKRALTEFPQISVESFMDGSFFSRIDTWFADTFPFRDILITCNEKVNDLYGVRNQVISGTLVAADDIPDIDGDYESKLLGGRREEEDIEVDEEVDTESDLYISNIATDYGLSQLNTSIEVSDIGTAVDSSASSTDVAVDGETLGSIFVAGNAAYNYYSFSQANSDAYADVVNSLTATLSGKSKVYSMIVPTSIDITLDDATRNSLNSSNQKKAILYMYSKMDKEVGKCYVYDVLHQHRDEYVYFRTDHHWTTLGAYYAYNVFIWQEGKMANSLDSYEKVEFDGFKGSFYSQSGISSLGDNPDTITAYKPIATNRMELINKRGEQMEYNIITDVSGWSATSKYSTFIGGDNKFVHVSNPDITDGSSILVVKESYGNALVPFLVDHYQNVYVIDYRYCSTTVSELVDTYNIGTVLMVNNIAATSTDSRIQELQDICR